MSFEIRLTTEPVRLTADADQDLRLASDVGRANELVLLAQVLEGPDVSISVKTGMQRDSADGWVTLGSFTANMSANQSSKVTFTNPLRYIRWSVSLGGGGVAGTFLVTGVGRRT